MRSRTLQLAVNQNSEIGKIVDLGVASDLVEIKHSGMNVQISRSSLVELLRSDSGNSQDLGRNTGPRDNGPRGDGPTDRHTIAQRRNSPKLSGGAAMIIAEYQAAEPPK